MNIEKQLADALRAVIDTAPGGVRANEADNIAATRDSILALAAYDAQQAQAQDVAAGAWSANAGSVWDHTGKWVADCNREHAARIVACVNAHDALVSALQNALPYVDKVRDLSGGDGDITAMNARAIIARVGGAK